MPRSLAIITHEYYPVLSGGTVFTHKLAEELSKLGWSVDVLTARVGPGQQKFERGPAFDVYRFSTARTSVSDSTLLEHATYFALGLPQMLARARARRYDLLFSVFAIPSGLVALVISKLLRVPCVVFVDAADTPGVESAMKTYVRHLASVFRLVTNRAAGVVVLEGLEDLALPHIRHGRFTSIPNGAVIPAERASPNRNGPKLQLLSVGRLVLRKGFQTILQALGLVRRIRDDFHLRIVGYGRAEDDIRQALEQNRVTDHVELLGRVEYSQLGPHYLRSDAYLFYGAREGSSLAMIEAAAHGLPIIASDHPGNRAYVEHGRSGMLVPHTGAEALADALLQLLDHRDQLAGLGERSRQIAEHYSWARIAARYDAFFNEVLAKGDAA
jgi:glycosyltransferase involved in cell wall biosynthesis